MGCTGAVLKIRGSLLDGVVFVMHRGGLALIRQIMLMVEAMGLRLGFVGNRKILEFSKRGVTGQNCASGIT